MYPLIRKDDRPLSPDYHGLVITCDVDKTYLDTDFKSLKGLCAIPLEWAEDKLALPGMAPLLRGFRFGGEENDDLTPFYFLTASPPFLARALARKMLLDGVQSDGLTCKDWKRVLFVRRKPRWLKHQLSYKLSALLNQRRALPRDAREILIGDDVETDALAYAVYADLISGNMDERALIRLARTEGCDEEEIHEILEAYHALELPGDRVEWIYILLEQGSPPALFRTFGDHLTACRGAFQLALHAVCRKTVRFRHLPRVARDIVARGRNTPEGLVSEIEDGVARGFLDPERCRPIHEELYRQGLLPAWKPYPAPDADLAPPSRNDRGGNWVERRSG